MPLLPSLCKSVCPEQLNGYSLHFMSRRFTKICQNMPDFCSNRAGQQQRLRTLYVFIPVEVVRNPQPATHATAMGIPDTDFTDIMPNTPELCYVCI